MRLSRIAIVIALSLFTSPALAATAPGDGFDVARYDLALTPDIQNRTVAGREVITLRVTGERLQRLSFSANALSIDSARSTARPSSSTRKARRWISTYPSRWPGGAPFG